MAAVRFVVVALRAIDHDAERRASRHESSAFRLPPPQRPHGEGAARAARGVASHQGAQRERRRQVRRERSRRRRGSSRKSSGHNVRATIVSPVTVPRILTARSWKKRADDASKYERLRANPRNELDAQRRIRILERRGVGGETRPGDDVRRADPHERRIVGRGPGRTCGEPFRQVGSDVDASAEARDRHSGLRHRDRLPLEIPERLRDRGAVAATTVGHPEIGLRVEAEQRDRHSRAFYLLTQINEDGGGAGRIGSNSVELEEAASETRSRFATRATHVIMSNFEIVGRRGLFRRHVSARDTPPDDGEGGACRSVRHRDGARAGRAHPADARRLRRRAGHDHARDPGGRQDDARDAAALPGRDRHLCAWSGRWASRATSGSREESRFASAAGSASRRSTRRRGRTRATAPM